MKLMAKRLKIYYQENGFKNVELRKDLNGKDRMICGSEIIWSTMFPKVCHKVTQ
jgi:hypothetical protein